MNRIPAQRKPIDDTADMALIQRSQAGDSAAFGELYARYQNMVFSIVLQRCYGDTRLAEDLSQDVWAKAFRTVDSITYGSPVAWLTTIARNRVIDHYRTHRVKREVLDWDMPYADRPDGSLSTEDAVASTETLDLLLDVLRQLSELQYEAIYLTGCLGMTAPEAGLVMGRSKEAVRALVLRGRRALQPLISEVYPCAL